MKWSGVDSVRGASTQLLPEGVARSDLGPVGLEKSVGADCPGSDRLSTTRRRNGSTDFDKMPYIGSVNLTLETILTGLLHAWAVWRAGRHCLSYPQVWPEDRHHVMTTGEIFPEAIRRLLWFFDFSIRRLSTILDYLGRIWTTLDKYLVVSFTAQNLIAIDGVVSIIIWKFGTFDWKTPIQAPKMGFWGFDL